MLFLAALLLVGVPDRPASAAQVEKPAGAPVILPAGTPLPAVPVLPEPITGIGEPLPGVPAARLELPAAPSQVPASGPLALPGTPLQATLEAARRDSPRRPSMTDAGGALRAAAGDGLGALEKTLREAPPAGGQAALNEAWDLAKPRAAEGAETPATPSGPSRKAPAPRLARGPISNLLANGIPAGMNRLVEGEILFWDPKGHDLDPYIAGPHDDKNMVHAKTSNEVEGLRRVWLDLRGALDGRASSDALAEADAQIAAAAREIASGRLKAEVVVGSLPAGEKAGAGLIRRELLSALKNRTSLLYLKDDIPNMTLEGFHADLKRIAKDRVMVKVFDRFLRLLYGFDAKDAGAAMEERMNAWSRRMAVGELFPIISREIEAGRTPEQAINAALAKVHQDIEAFKSRLLADRKNLTNKKNFTFAEELAAAFEAVKDGLRSYDYVFEQSDLPDIARAKMEAEWARHEAVRARLLARAGQDPALLALLGQFDAHMRVEILEKGRPAPYAAAEFFYIRQDEIEALNMELGDKGQEGPLDLLMFYSHAWRGGGAEAREDRDIVVVARQIRDEADYQDLRLSFREHGRVVGIVTAGSEDRAGASRMPHWVIFAKADGIVPLPWARLGGEGATLADIAHTLERPGGRPGLALINGRRGQLVINPDDKVRSEWLTRAHSYERLDDYYKSRALRPAAFAGAPVRFLADEADPRAYRAQEGHSALEASGAAGVGLLRMEQLMREIGAEWDEKRLAAELKAMLARPLFKGGAPLIARLFDFEADKIPSFLRDAGRDRIQELLKTHSNVRLYLDKSQPEYREFGKMQLKAFFDAQLGSPGANLRVLFSNVKSAKEIRAIEALVAEAAEEYLRDHPGAENASALARLPIGYMVEDVETVKRLKPFMAEIARLQAEKPAERFLAIGTNDYQSSLLRGDKDAVEKLALLDPRLVSGIWEVARAAQAQRLELTVDGEWGSSPKMLAALLALRALHNTAATPVVYTSRAPELYELARTLTFEDLAQPAAGRRGQDMRSLLARMSRRRHPPTLEQFDRAAAELAERAEDRILSRLFEKP